MGARGSNISLGFQNGSPLSSRFRAVLCTCGEIDDCTWMTCNPTERYLLWIAQGFGSGRMRPAPGTWGSGVGLAWAALLIIVCPPWVFWIFSVAAVPPAIWICGRAEQLLGEMDPSSVVLDEIVAMPFCFYPLLWKLGFFFGETTPDDPGQPGLAIFVAAFVLFRFFDVLKPPPIRQLQRLPGGWGVVVDDLVAAGFVGVVVVLLPLS